jgi:hypothetical protein
MCRDVDGRLVAADAVAEPPLAVLVYDGEAFARLSPICALEWALSRLTVAELDERDGDKDEAAYARSLIADVVAAIAAGEMSQELLEEAQELDSFPLEEIPGASYPDWGFDAFVALRRGAFSVPWARRSAPAASSRRPLRAARPREARRRRSASRCRSPGRPGADDDPHDDVARAAAGTAA